MPGMSQDARLDEEQSTSRRARILGMAYIDASQIANKQLFRNILPLNELYSLKIIPIKADAHHITFGITTTTSQQTMVNLRQRFADQTIDFALISDTSYHDYMKLYDPPKEIIYKDIELTTAGTEDLVKQVSTTLGQVRAIDMLAYLVQQAHKLAASDIHLENQAKEARIRRS